MKVWNDDGKTLTNEYLEARLMSMIDVQKQVRRFNAATLGMTGVGGKGPAGALEELAAAQLVLEDYKQLRDLKESSKPE